MLHEWLMIPILNLTRIHLLEYYFTKRSIQQSGRSHANGQKLDELHLFIFLTSL